MAKIGYTEFMPENSTILDVFSSGPARLTEEHASNYANFADDDSSNRFIIRGENFKYDDTHITKGVITSFLFTDQDTDVMVSVTNIKVDVADLTATMTQTGLSAAVKMLFSGNDRWTGSEGNDFLTGYAGNDFLNGGEGSDRLTGNRGNDTFVFNTVLSASNVDTITDFNHKADTINLDHAAFRGLAEGQTLTAEDFKLVANADSADGVDRTDRILYDKTHGDLYFDRDGSKGHFDRILFAHVHNGTSLNSTDFHIV